MPHDVKERRGLGSATLPDPAVTTTSEVISRVRATADNAGLDAANLTKFSVDLILEAIAYGESATWERRAELFKWAMSKPGDYPGRSSVDERQARDARLAATALACRRRAWLARNPARVRRG